MAYRVYFKCECGNRFRSTLISLKRRRFCPLCKLEVFDLYRVPSLKGRPRKWMYVPTDKVRGGKVVLRRVLIGPNYHLSGLPQPSSPMPDSGTTKLSPRESAERSAQLAH